MAKKSKPQEEETIDKELSALLESEEISTSVEAEPEDHGDREEAPLAENGMNKVGGRIDVAVDGQVAQAENDEESTEEANPEPDEEPEDDEEPEEQEPQVGGKHKLTSAMYFRGTLYRVGDILDTEGMDASVFQDLVRRGVLKVASNPHA